MKNRTNTKDFLLQTIISTLIAVFVATVTNYVVWHYQYSIEMEQKEREEKIALSKEVILNLMRYEKAYLNRLEYTILSELNGTLKDNEDYKEFFESEQALENLAPSVYSEYKLFYEVEILLSNELLHAEFVFDEETEKAIQIFREDIFNMTFIQHKKIYEEYRVKEGDVFKGDKVIFEIDEMKNVISNHYRSYLNDIHTKMMDDIHRSDK